MFANYYTKVYDKGITDFLESSCKLQKFEIRVIGITKVSNCNLFTVVEMSNSAK